MKINLFMKIPWKKDIQLNIWNTGINGRGQYYGGAFKYVGDFNVFFYGNLKLYKVMLRVWSALREDITADEALIYTDIITLFSK